MTSEATPLRLGVIGCGGFGLYALQHFAQIDGIRLAGMAGTHREAAILAAKRFGLPDIEDVEVMVQRDDIDLVYIATPPFLHHPQAMLALQAGKHVICEKPLATTLEQADGMIALAGERDRLLIANLMQRYNPLFDAVKRLIDEKPLGEVLHGYFENYAADENLPPKHWFWDAGKSGGIFIEHGVHFFDLFAGWLGTGSVVAAQRSLRPGSGVEEQVNCACRYGDNGVLVNMYHGFTNPGRLDRQQLRLVFERGEITLEEWVPVRAHVHAITDEAGTRMLEEIFPGARLDASYLYGPKERACGSRHKEYEVSQMIDMVVGEGLPKYTRYGELLRAMMRDQAAWIRDRSHERKVTHENGRRSLAMAIEADRLARGAS
jgi:predicted dehydrogenase